MNGVWQVGTMTAKTTRVEGNYSWIETEADTHDPQMTKTGLEGRPTGYPGPGDDDYDGQGYWVWGI